MTRAETRLIFIVTCTGCRSAVGGMQDSNVVLQASIRPANKQLEAKYRNTISEAANCSIIGYQKNDTMIFKRQPHKWFYHMNIISGVGYGYGSKHSMLGATLFI